MRVQISSIVLTLIGLLFGAALVGVVVLYAGFYNVAATHQHAGPTYWLLHTGLRESVEHHARKVDVPPLDDEALRQRGLALYREHCVQCHGAPGVPPAPFALGLTPLPANLAHAAREFLPAELYWIVRNGIKMTGMPAWQFRLPERDLWAVVAFVRELAVMTPTQYAARTERVPEIRKPQPAAPPLATQAGDPARGKLALRQYACTTCHRIPEVVGGTPVGPPLEKIATRQYLAGVLPNNLENMVLWLRSPQKVDPLTAMPDLGVTERDAIDIAAFLYTLN